ncbi:MAG: hypothetical protein HY820_25575 [Acidobacteria bacterium]|nr:hypothetical protein [Acidobacteriota bacterium]
MITSPKQALEQLLAVLDQLEIAYAIGGSTASSVHGEPRTTFDIDVIARIDQRKLKDLLELTAETFYSDETTAHEAIALGRSFNLIHLLTAFKFDLFPSIGEPFRESQIARGADAKVSLPGGDLECAIISAEDCILAKLAWYHAGGGSGKQWSDIQGILRRKASTLDRGYLQKWAAALGVAGLLHQLLADSPPIP